MGTQWWSWTDLTSSFTGSLFLLGAEGTIEAGWRWGEQLGSCRKLGKRRQWCSLDGSSEAGRRGQVLGVLWRKGQWVGFALWDGDVNGEYKILAWAKSGATGGWLRTTEMEIMVWRKRERFRFGFNFDVHEIAQWRWFLESKEVGNIRLKYRERLEM